MPVQSIATLKENMPEGTPGGTTVLDMYDIVDTLEDRTTQEIPAKTASYTAMAGDNRRRLSFDSGVPVTLTLPNNLPVGWECVVFQKGLGQVTVAVGVGAVLNSYEGHNKTAGRWASAYVFVHTNASGTSAQFVISGQTAV